LTGGIVTVSDVSDEGFQIANGGTSYYVNDGSLAGDVYTSAVGNNANSGKSAGAPMASLLALLNAYDLDAGDVIYVDTGVYDLAANIVLQAQDSGVRIVGAGMGNTILDRGNTTSTSSVFVLADADDVSIEGMTLRGGYFGILADTGANADRITVLDNEIVGNTSIGLYVRSSNDGWRIEGNRVHANAWHGIEVQEGAAVIRGNEVFLNGQTGITASKNAVGAQYTITIADNVVRDNATNGIEASYNVLVTGNDAYNQRGGNGGFGIRLTSGAIGEGNTVHENRRGLYLGSGAIARGNEVHANVQAGIELDNATATGNRIHSNPIGIDGAFSSLIDNNVIYANTNFGIVENYPFDDPGTIVNNTIYQPVGDAIRFNGGSAVRYVIENNIFSVGAGAAINTTTANITGFVSDFNVFDRMTADAVVGVWGSVQRATLDAWRAATGLDARSVAGSPDYLDIDGADNVLGTQAGILVGSGFDDNFGLRRGSIAIDAGNAYVAPATDIEGRPRRDDAGTVDSGEGWPLYVPAGAGASDVAARAGEVALGLRSGNSNSLQNLGFGFTLYGQTYTQVSVNTNGYLHFAGPDGAGTDDNSTDSFLRNVRIAPMWDNLNTGVTGGDVFVDRSVANQIRFRWVGQTQGTTPASSVSFAVTLHADGTFRFDYGAGNSGLTPTVGVSGGNGLAFVLAAGYDGAAVLGGAEALVWTPTPDVTYYDIGAYEFQGNSGDTTPPVVASVANLPANGGTTGAAFTSIRIAFSESMDGVSARSAANYSLISAGADGVFYTPDDRAIALRPLYSFPETDLTLQLVDGVLPDGLYRLTLAGAAPRGIFDTAGNALDGNADGTGGDDYVHDFRIDRRANTAPEATDATATLDEDTSVEVVLAGTDADGDALTFSIAGSPAHGVIESFDPATHRLVYRPDADFNGTDTFRFRVDDGKLGTDEGVITLRVSAVNDAPVSGAVSLTTAEDTPVTVVLPGTDPETPRAQLAFELVTAPAHGSLVPGDAGTWLYTPDVDFNGEDAFTYRVRDRGDPNGSVANALASGEGSVTISVQPKNDTPVIDPIGTREVDEGSTLAFRVAATDPDNDVLTFSLLGETFGASLDASTGDFSWQSVDGPDARSFTVQVSDGRRAAEQTFDVVVRDVAPDITITGADQVDVGVNYTVRFSATDPGTDTITNWIVDWGDGRSTTLPGTASSATAAYGLAARYTIAVTAIDEDGTHRGAVPLVVTVGQPNRPPVAVSQTVVVAEDGSVAVTPGFDPDGEALAFELVSGPLHGTLSVFDPATRSITYTPDANFNGSDSVAFRLRDATLSSTLATLSFTVNAVNDAPEAHDDGPYDATSAVPLVVAAADGVLANDADVDGDALTARLVTGPAHGTIDLGADGGFVYTPEAGYVGADRFVYRATDGTADSSDATVSLDVSGPATLQVTAVEATASGAHVRFNRVIDPSVLNLYTASDGSFGAADVTLAGAVHGPVRGSLVVDADAMGVSFVKTGGVLPADAYTLTLRSGADAFRDAFGDPLDGNGDGTAGDAFTSGFVVAPTTAIGVSIADFMRGPGQDVIVPNGPTGALALPLRLTDAAGVKSLGVDILFATGLLDIGSVTLPAGVSGTITRTDIAGGIHLDVVFDVPLGAGAANVLDLVAHVPETAVQGAQQVIAPRNLEVRDATGGTIAAIADDAVHLVGYFLDADGSASYTRADVNLVQRVIVGLDGGFAAWRNTDPVIVADLNGNGQVTSLDASRFLQFVLGQPRTEIPPLPVSPSGSLSIAALASPDATSATTATTATRTLAPAAVASSPAMASTASSAPTTLPAVVDWSASLAPASLSTASTSPAETATHADDWKKAPWAKDLAQRLAQMKTSTEGTGILRSVLRPLIR
ncbi:MAG: tandem-95 repeat protein, partial [Betaproteobacteria bacterium]|nr:tandem-95 repeat protein [Betaproteobacteria bacterium]